MPKVVYLFCVVVYKFEGKEEYICFWKCLFWLSSEHRKIFFNITDFW